MARILAISEHNVTEVSRSDYIASTIEKRARAKASNASFWVFEHISENNRFVEFIEGNSEANVRDLVAAQADVSLWRAMGEL